MFDLIFVGDTREQGVSEILNWLTENGYQTARLINTQLTEKHIPVVIGKAIHLAQSSWPDDCKKHDKPVWCSNRRQVLFCIEGAECCPEVLRSAIGELFATA